MQKSSQKLEWVGTYFKVLRSTLKVHDSFQEFDKGYGMVENGLIKGGSVHIIKPSMLRMVLPCCAGIPISLKRADVMGEVGVTG